MRFVERTAFRELGVKLQVSDHGKYLLRLAEEG